MVLRSDCEDITFPQQVTARPAEETDLAELKTLLHDFCSAFDYDISMVLNAPFTVITPDSANPYRQMYVAN